MSNVVPFPTSPPSAESATVELDLGALFDEHGTWLLRVLHRLTGRKDLAEDLVQEVFLIVWKRRHEIQDQLGIRTWLYRVAVNVVRHRRRSENRYGAMLGRFKHALWGTTPGPDESLERYQRGKAVHEVIAKLSDKQREVFVLFELEELEGNEIADILDISVNTVWSRLRLARASFKAHWEEVNA